MTHGPQCPCCAGTDVAHRLGAPCYAEEQQRQWDEERAAEEAAYEAYWEHGQMADAISDFASAAMEINHGNAS